MANYNDRNLEAVAAHARVVLFVRDVEEAAVFCVNVFAAEWLHQDDTADCGCDASDHAWLRLGDMILGLVRENPNWQSAHRADWPRSPRATGAATSFCSINVGDVDDVVQRALLAGATLPHEDAKIQTVGGRRLAQFVDPQGHIWRVISSI